MTLTKCRDYLESLFLSGSAIPLADLRVTKPPPTTILNQQLAKPFLIILGLIGIKSFNVSIVVTFRW
jgi:hypothetical protein